MAAIGTRIIAHPLTWCLGIFLAVLACGIATWHTNRFRLWRTLAQIEIVGDGIRVDGIPIGNLAPPGIDSAKHGRWEFWKSEERTPQLMAACNWNTFDDDHESLLHLDLDAMYHQAASAVRYRTGRSPILYRWVDSETWPRHSAIWQLDTAYIEVTVSQNNDNDALQVMILPGQFTWVHHKQYASGRQTGDDEVRSILRR